MTHNYPPGTRFYHVHPDDVPAHYSAVVYWQVQKDGRIAGHNAKGEGITSKLPIGAVYSALEAGVAVAVAP